MANEYKVLKIEELSKIDDVGKIIPYYRHTIRTAGGTVLRVNIDEADFTPDKVAKILTDKAKQADRILEL